MSTSPVTPQGISREMQKALRGVARKRCLTDLIYACMDITGLTADEIAAGIADASDHGYYRTYQEVLCDGAALAWCRKHAVRG